MGQGTCDNIRMMTYMKRNVLLFYMAVLLVLPLQAQTVVEFTPDTETVLKNPLNGWVMYLGRRWDENFWTNTQPQYDAMPTSEGTVVRVSDYANTAYVRMHWSMLEPEEGRYEWRNPESRVYKTEGSGLPSES